MNLCTDGIINFLEFQYVFSHMKYEEIAVSHTGEWINKNTYDDSSRLRPLLILRAEKFRGLPSTRLKSLAEDINYDFIWIKAHLSENTIG